MIEGKVFLTGGSGTLGKALMHLARSEMWDATFTVFSRSELLQAQMKRKYPDARYVLGDVRDFERVKAAIAGHDIVIHAAAMKRIPECEEHPGECFKTNILGSFNVIRASLLHGVSRCIGISTDKACRATTMYGASKLTMEKLFRSHAHNLTTAFSLVRYGNVVASRGSVVEAWERQNSESGQITITDPEMTRFFMSPTQAARLVWDASKIANGACLVPKMKSVTIGDLASFIAPNAHRMIVGLRSEEKRHEDLIHSDELCRERRGYEQYVIGEGEAGMTYTSFHAERMTKQEFMDMLVDARSQE